MRVENYKFLELIARDEERESFKARDLSNHREVIVHVLISQPNSTTRKPELAELGRLLFSQPYPAGLVIAGEVGGKFYIVTELRGECYDIRKWLETQSGTKPISKSPDEKLTRAGAWKVPSDLTPATDSPPDSLQHPGSAGPGDFTRMFAPAASPNEKPGEVKPEEHRTTEPGEFTRMFQLHSDAVSTGAQGTSSPDPISAEVPQPPASRPPDAASTSADVHDTPTLVKRTSDQKRAAKPPAETRDSGPGEFTRMFEVRPNADPLSRTPPAPFQDSISPEVSRPSASSGSDAGTFTQMFRTTSVPEERRPDPAKPILDSAKYTTDDFRQTALPPVSPLEWKQPDVFPTEDMTRPSGLSPLGSNEAATGVFKVYNPDEKEAKYKQAAGPSEYTQMFTVPVATPPDAPVPPVTEASPPAGAAAQLNVKVSQPQIAMPPLKADVSPPPVAAPQVNPAIPQPQIPVPQLQPRETPGWHSYLPLILIMNVLFLAAVFLIIYLVLKK